MLDENLQNDPTQPASGWTHYVGSADYLRWLASNGYPLSPVEEIITGEKDEAATSVHPPLQRG